MKNFVIIGPSGYIAKRHLKAIKNLGGTIAGYHDLHESTFEGQNSETKFLDSLDAIKDFISNHSVDFLIVCSPNFLHFQHIKIGLESGVNVICEKPIVLNMDNFNELSILEAKYNKKVYTIYQLRLHEINKQMKNFVRSGSKSRLLYVAHRDESYLNSWKVDPDKSGGILFNLGIHYFDFLVSHYGKIESFHVEDRSNVKVQNNVSIYDNITIEDNVFCGPSMVFTNVINPRAFIERKDEYKSTLLQEGCSIGANATVLCGVTLGKYCLVGAGSVVTKSVKDFALIMGVPGKQVGWVSKFGKSILIPDNAKEFDYTCPDTDDKYHFDGENLFLVS